MPDAARLVPQDLLAILNSAAFVPEIATELIVIEELVPFESVADFPALAVPTFTVPNDKVVGLTNTDPDAAGAYPVNATFCGVLLAESLKFSVADRFPVAVGANTMFAVQLAAAARLDPHVLLNTLKSPGFVPEKAMPLIVMVAVPLFVSATTFCPPMPPTGTDAQLKDVGDTVPCAATATGNHNTAVAVAVSHAGRRTLHNRLPRNVAAKPADASRTHDNTKTTHVDMAHPFPGTRQNDLSAEEMLD